MKKELWVISTQTRIAQVFTCRGWGREWYRPRILGKEGNEGDSDTNKDSKVTQMQGVAWRRA